MRKSGFFLLTFLVSITACKMEFDPNAVDAHVIFYSTEKGETPKPKAITHGAKIQQQHLPAVTTDYYVLDGWYLGDEKIEPGYVVEKDIDLVAKWTLTGYDFNWIDTSKSKIKCDSRSDLSNDGYYLKATQTSNKGNSLNNWVINDNGAHLIAIQGFEAKVKFNSYMKNAGIQFYSKTNYDYYWFTIQNDGRFIVKEVVNYKEDGESKSTSKNIVNSKDEKFKIKTDDWNNIKVVTTPMLDTEVYINGYKACTILKDELKITKDSLTFTHQTTDKASKETPACAWLHFLSYQLVK